MKINLTEEVTKSTLLSHVILHAISDALINELVKKDETNKGIVADVKLTVNGHEIDIKSFMDHWQSQVSELITERAKELISDNFADVSDMLYDLEERMKSEIEKRLEDWEKKDKEEC